MLSDMQDLNVLGLDRSLLFRNMPKYEHLSYEGHTVDNIQRFLAVNKGQQIALLTLTVIRQEEDFVWASAKDLLDRPIRDAASRMRGIYSFDLLSFDFRQEIKTFNCNELYQVLVNSARPLRAGSQTPVKYSSCYGILKKMVDEQRWGKLSFRTAVECMVVRNNWIYNKFNAILKSMPDGLEQTIILINDLSSLALYDLDNEIEKSSVRKLSELQRGKEFKLYVQDARGMHVII